MFEYVGFNFWSPAFKAEQPAFQPISFAQSINFNPSQFVQTRIYIEPSPLHPMHEATISETLFISTFCKQAIIIINW